MSKLTIKNDLQTELSIEHTPGSGAKLLGSQDFKYIRDTIKDLSDITPNDGDVVLVKGYHEINDGGGGLFVYSSDEPKSNHNGGTVIDSSKTFPDDWTNQTELTDWFTGSNTTNGCWKRIFNGSVNVKWFGANSSLTNNEIMIKKACELLEVDLNNEKFTITNPLVLDLNNIKLFNGEIEKLTTTTNNSINSIIYIEEYRYIQLTDLVLSSIGGDGTVNGIYTKGTNNLELNNVKFLHLKYGYYSNNNWLVNLYNLYGNRCESLIRIEPGNGIINTGTSVLMKKCWLEGTPEGVTGCHAYHIENLDYSTLDTCAADHIVGTSYYFKASKLQCSTIASEDITGLPLFCQATCNIGNAVFIGVKNTDNFSCDIQDTVSILNCRVEGTPYKAIVRTGHTLYSNDMDVNNCFVEVGGELITSLSNTFTGNWESQKPFEATVRRTIPIPNGDTRLLLCEYPDANSPSRYIIGNLLFSRGNTGSGNQTVEINISFHRGYNSDALFVDSNLMDGSFELYTGDYNGTKYLTLNLIGNTYRLATFEGMFVRDENIFKVVSTSDISNEASIAPIGSKVIYNSDIRTPNLPTSDPGVVGQLWNDSGTVKISAG